MTNSMLAGPPPLSRASLRESADAAGLIVGTAVNTAVLQSGEEKRYRETLVREFNGLVAENAFKPSEVWVGPREYRFDETDALVAFARQNGMLVRGHTLVWHQQAPRWLAAAEDAGLSPNVLRDLLRDYIHAIVGRYRGQIAHWDVVNEAVRDAEPGEQTPGLRSGKESVWERILGSGYIQLAFEWAHEADPDARLFYNDYEIESSCPKSDAVYALLKTLLANGAPVHGIGFQGHLVNGWRVGKSHTVNVRRFVDLGLEWLVTEADVRVPLENGLASETQLAEQATGYADLAHLCLTVPHCRGLFVWGFTDAHSWIPGFRPGWGAALLFDEAYRAKPAYEALRDTLTASQGS